MVKHIETFELQCLIVHTIQTLMKIINKAKTSKKSKKFKILKQKFELSNY